MVSNCKDTTFFTIANFRIKKSVLFCSLCTQHLLYAKAFFASASNKRGTIPLIRNDKIKSQVSGYPDKFWMFLFPRPVSAN